VLTGALTDAAVQGVEGLTEGKPFNPAELVVSGVLAGGGHLAGEEIGGRLRAPGGGLQEEGPPADLASAMGPDREARFLTEAQGLKAANPRLAHVPDDQLAALRGYTSNDGPVRTTAASTPRSAATTRRR
jgi:hypothetical protein